MLRRAWIAADLVLVAACAMAAVAMWRHGIEHTWFLPMPPQPGFESTHYSGPWLALAAVLVAVAGLAAIDLVARAVVRSR
ncbi:MAG: hypothetical protein J2P18_14310 [Nocardia sp.]|nr:hypothetical protein [Nocardia sp.]